jgi:hypothetical protein
MYPAAVGDRTRVNDISLMFGGRFDIYANRRSSHREHRFGTEVDIKPYRYKEASYRSRFEIVLSTVFASWIVEPSNGDVSAPSFHYHARSPSSVYNR